MGPTDVATVLATPYASIMFDTKDLESTRAAQFQALADPLRLQIVAVLERAPRCVCEIQSALAPIAANLLSYHLGILRSTGLISAQRRGRWMDYRLEYAALAALRASLPEFPPDSQAEREPAALPVEEHAKGKQCTGPRTVGRQRRGRGKVWLGLDPDG